MAWYHDALCQEIGIEVFFPGNGEHDVNRNARGTCKRCEVQDECLEDALKTHDFYGIRAGLDGEERAAILRLRRKQKRDAA